MLNKRIYKVLDKQHYPVLPQMSIAARQNNTFIAKYKPYFIDNFTFSPNIIETIKVLIKTDNLNTLFIGNPSSGKTSLLFAIVREYYHLDKNAPFPENNILFINNLKEQGIQYFRTEMKTFCQSHSAIHGRKKLVIIDDIDNINEQSQQVFRNYMDKHKKTVHFISVCTNIQKVIESIQSRTHIIKLSATTNDQVGEIMTRIIANENIQITDDAKQYIISMSQTSIRNMINYIEKIFIYGKPIDLETCKNICSSISFQKFKTYIENVKQNNLQEAINVLYDIHDYGYSVIDILDFFFTFVKQTDILAENVKYQIIPYLCKYITVFHDIHEDEIELALFTNNLIDIMKKCK
jgi:DNA polymerase III delta prime subunit